MTADTSGAHGADHYIPYRTHGGKGRSAAPSAPDKRELGDSWRRGDPAEIVAASADPLAALLDLFESERPTWHADAACRGSGVDFTSENKRERARAFTICGRCTVREACLEWALEVGDTVAILGAADPAARRAMRRARPTVARTPEPIVDDQDDDGLIELHDIHDHPLDH